MPQYITSFEDAGLRTLLLENIKKAGYVKPTPVQKGSIAVILAKRDLIACAVTGSGKTVMFDSFWLFFITLLSFLQLHKVGMSRQLKVKAKMSGHVGDSCCN